MAKQAQQLGGIQELKTAIREKRLGRVYIFHGEETFLMHHYLGQVQKILVDKLTESFNFHKLSVETFDIQSFTEAVENLPMMAENTMVWVDEIDIFRLPEDEREKLAQLLTDIPDYCTVVFTYETVEWKPDKRIKLWETVSKYAQIVEFAKQDQRDLIAWISRHFAAAGKRIPQELCAYLIDITDGTMTALSSEISKICAYSGSDVICKADIDAVVEPVLDAVVFQMTECLSRGDYGQALVKLRQLLKMQELPLMILGAVGNHFRRLSTARILLDGGKNAQDLMRLTGMKDYPARKTVAAAGRFSAPFYARATELIMQTDRNIKTSQDDPERLLELLIIQLAQEARNA